MEQLYFLTRYNQQWNAVGFEIDPNSLTNGVGTLYRYGVTNVAVTNLFNQVNNFVLATLPLSANTNFNRIIDGVVDFRIRAFNINGNVIIGRISPTINGITTPSTRE